MKRFITVVAAVLALAAVPTAAQSSTHTASYKASGTITRVDAAAGRVTIAHGPVQQLKWPAMTMSFGVGDRALLERAQPGKKVDFQFAKQGSDYVITKID
jgi:Cu(I)/Ag(I) efflux system periplasmic protein CusF